MTEQTFNRTDLRYATLKVAEEGSLTQLKRLWMTPQAESTLGQLERRGLVVWGTSAYELTVAGAALLAEWEATP